MNQPAAAGDTPRATESAPRCGGGASEKETKGPMRRGLTIYLRLSPRETRSGAGRRPRFCLLSRDIPLQGEARRVGLSQYASARPTAWAAETDGTRKVRGGRRAALSFCGFGTRAFHTRDGFAAFLATWQRSLRSSTRGGSAARSQPRRDRHLPSVPGLSSCSRSAQRTSARRSARRTSSLRSCGRAGSEGTGASVGRGSRGRRRGGQGDRPEARRLFDRPQGSLPSNEVQAMATRRPKLTRAAGRTAPRARRSPGSRPRRGRWRRRSASSCRGARPGPARPRAGPGRSRGA
jgi:hypothetical protein